MASLLLIDAGDEATGLAAAAAASHGAGEKVRALEARVKELEMEQTLMQRELDNMSDVAQRSDAQLRWVASAVQLQGGVVVSAAAHC